MMSPLMKAMAGKGHGRTHVGVAELQHSGLLDPGSRGPKMKKGTGKRLTSKERAKLKKQREKDLRRKKRGRRKIESERTRPGSAGTVGRLTFVPPGGVVSGSTYPDEEHGTAASAVLIASARWIPARRATAR
jgi:hypothetical protein